MVLNSFKDLKNKVFVYYPNFFMHPIDDMNFSKDKKLIIGRNNAFGNMVQMIKCQRIVKREFFDFDFHICVVNEDFHWFVLIVNISKQKSEDGVPMTVTITYLYSSRRDLRNYRVIARLNQIGAYYRQLIFLAWGKEPEI